jgi:hypothetical protein
LSGFGTDVLCIPKRNEGRATLAVSGFTCEKEEGTTNAEEGRRGGEKDGETANDGEQLRGRGCVRDSDSDLHGRSGGANCGAHLAESLELEGSGPFFELLDVPLQLLLEGTILIALQPQERERERERERECNHNHNHKHPDVE